MHRTGGLHIELLKKLMALSIAILVTGIFLTAVIPIHTNTTAQSNSTCVKVNKETILSDHIFAGSVDDSGNIYTFYQNEQSDQNQEYDIFISSSTDGGKTFSEKVQINDVDGTAGEISPSSIVAYGDGNVCTVWPDERSIDYINDIYFDRSSDSGKTFGEDIKINKDHEDSIWTSPCIDVDANNNVYVLWHIEGGAGGDYIYLSKLNSGSSEFTEKIWVNEGVGDYQQWLPDLTVSNEGTIYIVWQNSLDPSTIQFIKSSDGGNTFTTAVEISTEGFDPDNADIAEYNSNLYVVWHEEHDRYEKDEIRFVKSHDDGKSWTKQTSIGIAQNGVSKSQPCITVDNQGNIFVSWAEFHEFEQKIVIMKSSDKGGSWSRVAIENIESTATDPFYVAIETDSYNDLYVMWGDGYEGYWDIYFAKIESDSIQEIESDDNQSSDALIIAVPIIVFIVILFMAVAATEAGRYSLFKFIASPKYSRLKRDDVLNNDTRVRILNQINSNPGVHFKYLQKSFNLGSGSLAYHLGVLEREEYIVSKREGFYKRFFPFADPAGRISAEQYMATQPTQATYAQPVPAAQAPAAAPAAAPAVPAQNNSNAADNIQDRILTVIRTYPGLTQTELAAQVGLTVTGVNYHINIMASAGVIRVNRDGKATRLYLIEV